MTCGRRSTVIAALVGARLGLPILDPLAALVVAGFIGYSGFQIARATTGILSDRIVIADAELERVVMSVAGVLGCHHIRTRGSADHVFLDLHVWLPPRDAADGRARAVARRQGSADGAISADRGRDHSHRAASARGSIGGLPELTFDEFVARKEAEAVEADLSPFVTEVDQPPADVIPIGNGWTRRIFDGRSTFPRAADDAASGTSLVFVQSGDGNTGAANPSSLGGGETDKYLIYEGLSRVAADAVMAGAETVRGGRIVLSVWHPELVALRAALRKPRHPVQIVATIRGSKAAAYSTRRSCASSWSRSACARS